jgi:hypothetical protein
MVSRGMALALADTTILSNGYAIRLLLGTVISFDFGAVVPTCYAFDPLAPHSNPFAGSFVSTVFPMRDTPHC